MLDLIFSLEMLGTLIGVAYVVLEYRASVWLWPVGVVMPAIYIVIYYQSGIYADMGISVYFLLAAIYGWVVWAKASRAAASTQSAEASSSDEVDDICYTSSKEWLISGVVFAALFALLAYILISYTSSTVPYCDSFTTALSVVGMWMLAHKRIEHWLVWIVVDVVSAVMYIEKDLYPTASLYTLYTVIAIAGYFKWRRMIKNS